MVVGEASWDALIVIVICVITGQKRYQCVHVRCQERNLIIENKCIIEWINGNLMINAIHVDDFPEIGELIKTSSIFWKSILAYFWTNRRRVFCFDPYIIVWWKYSKSVLHKSMCSNIQYLSLLLFKLLLNYTLFYTLKTLFTVHIEVYAYVTANYGYFKQSDCQLQSFITVKFQIHDGCHPLKIFWVSKIYFNWDHLLTTYYIYSHA